MTEIRSIQGIDVTNKKVIVRTDLNIPIIHGKIIDLSRITRILPTLHYLIKNNAKIILLSHYGRPKGKFVLRMSLSPVVDQLSKMLNRSINFAMDIFSQTTKQKIENLNPGEIILLENLRFHPEEENNDRAFAEKLASLGDIYINEAFACSHRSHASISSLPELLPSYAGMLLQEEIFNLNKYLKSPTKKVMSIVGGSKVSSKINLLSALVEKSDYLVIGGAMANTFLKAQGHSIGNSMYDEEYIDFSSNLLKKAANKCQIILPHDIVTAKSLTDTSRCNVYSIEDIPSDEIIFDIGPSSTVDIMNKMEESKTLIWNGPLGAFENSNFSAGTTMVSRKAAKLTTTKQLISIVGGGDTVAAISEFEHQFTYASTGGGAFLEWLEGKALPGLEAIKKNSILSTS